MVAKKYKSKRVSASMRYKIQKKVRDHNKKVRKEERNNPSKSNKKKDPGIPSSWPYKEQILNEINDNRMKIEEEKKRQKEERMVVQNSNRSLDEFAAEAAARTDEFESSAAAQSVEKEQFQYKIDTDAALDGSLDNSKKAFYKEFRKVVENSDVLLEVLDARDPMGCRALQVEELILSSGQQKRVVLVLNKIDLVPKDVVEKWLRYLRNFYPTIAFKASTQQQRSNLGHSALSLANSTEKSLKGSECMGADDLVKLLKNYCRNQNIKTGITVGVIGYPNVGKSSVINSLKRSKACGVGSTPGLTKSLQLITLDKNIKLLDCPGIVFSQAKSLENASDAILRNCVKVELLQDPQVPVEAILRRCSADQLEKLYGIPAFRNVEDFLVLIARRLGRMCRGGRPDLNAAARSVIQDWNSGKIAYYTQPPEINNTESMGDGAAIVQQWSKEFSLSDFSQSSVLDAASSENANFIAVNPMVVDVDMNAVPAEDMSDVSDEDEDSDESESDSDMSSEEVDNLDLRHAPAMVAPAIKQATEQKGRGRNRVTIKEAVPIEVEMNQLDEADLEANQQVGKNRKKMMKQMRRKK